MTPNFPNDNYPKNFQEVKYCFTCKDHLPISHLHKDVPVNETDEGMEVYKKYAKEPQYSPLGAAIESLRCDLHDLFMRVNDLQELHYNHGKIIEHMNARVKFLEEHHTRQIDENRKISRRVDDIVVIELQLERNQFVAAFDRIEKLEQITTIANYKEFIDDMTCRIDQIDKYECHNRALIDELKKPEYSAIEFRLQKLEQEKVIYKQNTIDGIHDTLNVYGAKLLKLEQAYQADAEAVKALIFDGARDKERLDRQEERIEKLFMQITLGSYQGDLLLRIEKLEKDSQSDIEVNQELLRRENNQDALLEKLKNDIDYLMDVVAFKESVADAYTQLRDNTNERLRILEQMHIENVYKPIESGKKPHKCPVCEGVCYSKPELRETMQSMSIDGVQLKQGDSVYFKAICRTCEGKGIVWG